MPHADSTGGPDPVAPKDSAADLPTPDQQVMPDIPFPDLHVADTDPADAADLSGQEHDLKEVSSAADNLVEPTDCRNILICRAGCGYDEPCKQQCVDTATAAGQQAFLAVQNCALASCEAMAAIQATLQLCIVDVCEVQWETCLGGWGELSCSEMQACALACADEECRWGCLLAGTAPGQDLFWALQSCAVMNCQAQCGTDQDCLIDCAQGPCANLVAQCPTD